MLEAACDEAQPVVLDQVFFSLGAAKFCRFPSFWMPLPLTILDSSALAAQAPWLAAKA